jgi:hypothetical protein
MWVLDLIPKGRQPGHCVDYLPFLRARATALPSLCLLDMLRGLPLPSYHCYQETKRVQYHGASYKSFVTHTVKVSA